MKYVLYVNVGNLPKERAEKVINEYVELMKKYDPNTKYLVIPRHEGITELVAIPEDPPMYYGGAGGNGTNHTVRIIVDKAEQPGWNPDWFYTYSNPGTVETVAGYGVGGQGGDGK